MSENKEFQGKNLDEAIESACRHYDLKRDKLVWASQTDTTNPAGVQEMIADIAKATAFAIRKEGLLP